MRGWPEPDHGLNMGTGEIYADKPAATCRYVNATPQLQRAGGLKVNATHVQPARGINTSACAIRPRSINLRLTSIHSRSEQAMARRQMSLSGELDEGVQVAHVVGSSKDRKSDGWMNYWKQNSGGASLMLTLIDPIK